MTGLWWLMAPLFSAATQEKPSTSDPVQLSGTLGKKLKIEMKLWKNGNKLSGAYVYTHIGKDIRVEGDVDEKGGLRLEEFFDGRNTGVFSGRFLPGDRMKGEWSKPDGSGKRPFRFRRAPLARKAEPATVDPVTAANPQVLDHRLWLKSPFLRSLPRCSGICRIIPQAGRTSREARLADGSLSAASETDDSARKAPPPSAMASHSQTVP